MSNIKETWKDFFNDDYCKYGKYLYTEEQTINAVEGIKQILNLPKGSNILDLCCGYGRITIPLAKEGYNLVGIDGSSDLINSGIKEAERNAVEINFTNKDARNINFDEDFDAVINTGGAFGYTLDVQADKYILKNIEKSLKPGGKLIMEIHSRDGHLRSFNNDYNETNFDNTKMGFEYRFDPINSIWGYTFNWKDGENSKSSSLDFRLYTPSEIIRMLEEAGFENINVFGNWDQSALEVDHSTMILVCEKKRCEK
ncbi:class I SAM-dependent methyltransferase [Bacillus toyonensis]|uniref:class I SAM-dependent methyltransferase n=1 Tax=Bacillus toyonensis TaxID=155322 RepID=UPI000BEFB587|nr:class I SAM-dependent methyltransferase [Bacillus toyonensis]PEM43179.1 hypothetical protein CN636_17145 [Bacillus toyonensis]